jgi:hypothetical protein
MDGGVGLRPYGTARESFSDLYNLVCPVISFQNPIVRREYSREIRPETLSVFWENKTFRGRWTGLSV